MVKVRYATLHDVQPVLQFGKLLKEKNQLRSDIPVNDEDFTVWLSKCIMTTGVYPFVAEKDDKICGLLVLTETSQPWNNQYRYLTDLLFIAEQGGLKLVRTAKALAKKKGMDSILLSVSSKETRSDKFLSHIGQYAGGIYEIEV